MENIVSLTPTNIAIRLEIDRRRELLADLNLDDNMLNRPEESVEEQEDEEMNPFQNRDLIIVILELCPAETLNKLYRSNKYIRSIISENEQYLTVISEHKYQVVWGKYENLIKAYKAREDVILSLHSGISKVVQKEEQMQKEMLDSLTDMQINRSLMELKKTSRMMLIPGSNLQTIAGAVVESCELPQQNLEEPAVQIKEEIVPDLDDSFERQKLASLQSLIEHQKKIERDLPVYTERNAGKFRANKFKSYDDEVDLEQQFKQRQRKRLSEVQKRRIELLKVHEVDLRGIQWLSVCDDDQSTPFDVFDAFFSYKMVRTKKKFENYFRIAKGEEPVAYIGYDDFIPYHVLSSISKKLFSQPFSMYQEITRYNK